MNQQEKTINAEFLVGQRAMTGLLAIVNASDEDFNKMTAAIADSSGACGELATKMDDTLVGKFEILKSGISAVKNTIGGELAPTMYGLIEKSQSVVNAIQSMIDAFIAAKNQGNALDGIVAAIQQLLPSLQAIAGAGNLPGILQEPPRIAQKFIDKLHGLSAEGKTLQDFTEIFAKIALITPDLIAAGSGISAFGSVFSGIGNAINTVSQTFGTFQNTISGITQIFSGLPSQFGAIMNIFSGLAGSFGNVLKNMRNLTKCVLGIFSPLVSGIGKIFSAIGRKIAGLLAPIGNFITGTFSAITSKISGIFSSIGNAIMSKFGGVLTWVKTIAGNIGSALSGVLDSVFGFAGKIAGAFGSLLITLGKYALPFEKS